MIVMMIAITPSLNAVSRSLFMPHPSRGNSATRHPPVPLLRGCRLRRPCHRERRAHRGDPAPGVLLVLLEAPALAFGVEHQELPAVEAPGDRAEARDQRVAAGLHRHRETVRIEGGVVQGELAD